MPEGDDKADADGVRKFLESLPDAVRTRVQSLREIQSKCDEVKAKFTKERKEMEEKYRRLYEPLYSERKQIVTGWDNPPGGDDPPAGDEPGAVPGFWLKVLMSADMVGDHVTKRDQPVLKYLQDVRCDPIEAADNKSGFKLTFQFAPNPHFKPLTLEKTYHMGEDDTVLEKTEGTEIEWTEGHNPAFKVVKKKPKKGAPAGEPPKSKKVQTHSFFDFFSPPELPEGDDEEEINDIAELLVEDDFEMGCYLRDELIPQAVSWYTGELTCERDADEIAVVMDSDEDEEEDDDDDDDEES